MFILYPALGLNSIYTLTLQPDGRAIQFTVPDGGNYISQQISNLINGAVTVLLRVRSAATRFAPGSVRREENCIP